MIRNPFSLEKVAPGIHATLKRNFQIMPGATWLKFLLQQVPDRGEHLVRYYGWYSNRSRGDHMRNEGSESSRTARDDETDAAGRFDSDPDNQDSKYIKDVRSAWARLIKKVYEVDPLICPHCGGEMRFLAVIKELAVQQIISLTAVCR